MAFVFGHKFLTPSGAELWMRWSLTPCQYRYGHNFDWEDRLPINNFVSAMQWLISEQVHNRTETKEAVPDFDLRSEFEKKYPEFFEESDRVFRMFSNRSTHMFDIIFGSLNKDLEKFGFVIDYAVDNKSSDPNFPIFQDFSAVLKKL